MPREDTKSQFTAQLLRPEDPGKGDPWAFVILPREASARLPRRGRITIDGTINGQVFTALLEPDGQKSHWLKIDGELLNASGLDFGDVADFEIIAAEQEPEPDVPPDLVEALQASWGSRHLGGHHDDRPCRLDPLDYIGQAGENPHQAN